MRFAVTLRIIGYALAGTSIGLGMLAVRTYPGERTWVDRYEGRRDARHWTPHRIRVKCGWRILMCEELPAPNGPLASATEAALRNVEALICIESFSTHLAGLGRDVENRALIWCVEDTTGSAFSLGIDSKGRVYDLSWPRVSARVGEAYAAQLDSIESVHGAATLCPQSDDLWVTENRRWQLKGYNVGIYKGGDSVVVLDYRFGDIACHTG